MKLRDYLSAKAAALCALGIGGLYLLLVLGLAGFSRGLLLSVGLGLLTCCLLWLLLGWGMTNRRLRQLRQRIEALPEKYLLGEILPRPRDPVEQAYDQIMREISRSAVGAVERAQAERQDYQDYVERWVHEIKTPLTACSLILDNGGDSRKLRRELRRADDLTESILVYARLRTVEKDTQITPTNLRMVAERSLREEMDLLIAAGVSVTVEGEQTVRTDGKQLGFMLRQLFINCAKYCPGCRISITLEDRRLTVADDGPGIPAHELPRVTERGFTGAKWRGSGAGTGMGLYLVRALCDQMNMDMEIFSKEGQGTRFVFRFPA